MGLVAEEGRAAGQCPEKCGKQHKMASTNYRAPQCVVLLLVNLLYSFVHRAESVSSAVKPLRILLVKVQAFVAPVL